MALTLRETLVNLQIESAKKAEEELKNDIMDTYLQFISAFKKCDYACSRIVDGCKDAANKNLVEAADDGFIVKVIGDSDVICAIRTFCDLAFEAIYKMDKLHDRMICWLDRHPLAGDLLTENKSGSYSDYSNMVNEIKSYIPSGGVLHFTTEERIEFSIVNTECVVGYSTKYEVQMKVL